MILSSRDAWRRGGSAPAWPRLLPDSLYLKGDTCMPKVHWQWTFGQVSCVCFPWVLKRVLGLPHVSVTRLRSRFSAAEIDER